MSPAEKLVLKERFEVSFLGGLLRVLEIAGVRHALVTSPARAAVRTMWWEQASSVATGSGRSMVGRAPAAPPAPTAM